MQSKATDVTTYLAQLPEERRACLNQLRQLCLETLEGYSEAMEYGMPCYTKNGTVEVAFASQKNYISLYILKEAVVEAHRPELAGLNVGKGCIRYSKPEKMDVGLVQRLLVATRDASEQAC
ncbi:MAG: DUF1801 domain-containing protein [Chloroflexaceae bacterium]|jgi:uncharacterized protein YdhG (YjbR/CyaY superfamily)|nr:DUF1801 domain-containing protein [Chloroflexaceae bacterium]